MSARARAPLRRLLGRPPLPPFLDSDRYGLDPRFDLTAAELERHARSVAAWREADRFPIRSVQWLVPRFEHAAYGGIHTILRFADAFAREHGAEQRFCVFDARAGEERAIAARVAAAFPALGDAPVTGPASLADLRPSDAAIATFWPTAYLLARHDRARAKFLFLQDREAGFYAPGAAAALAGETLRLGLPAIVNSPSLRGLTDAPQVTFTPSVDLELFRPPHPGERPDAPVRVVFYGRPSAMRNGFGLGLAVLRQLRERYGDRVDLVAAGEDWEPARYGLEPGVVRNLGLLADLPTVAELYRSCHVGLFFMLTPHTSYQPLELMASGAACVTNENPATAWLLEPDRTALVARPLAALLADQVGRLVEDPALRERLAAAGRERVEQLPPWRDEIARVWRWMTKEG